MLRTLAWGYATIITLSASGYVFLGGDLWIWVAFTWLAAAPVTLVLAQARKYASTLDLSLPQVPNRKELLQRTDPALARVSRRQ